ncbi:MAG: hypothetical protein ABT05_04730 [Lautropia sp. SCN 66-9]|nr:MAG: hypothetical protein ABT05_04730 [Lautropia sp. SCN 66-9]
MMQAWLGAVFWAALGCGIAWQAYLIGLGSLEEPGTGMMSFGLGVAMAAIAVGRLFAALRAAPAAGDGLAGLISARVAAVCVLLAAYFTAFEHVGFVLSTFVLLLVLFAGFGDIRKGPALIMSAALTAGTYGVFKFLLGTQLPVGWLG